MSELTVGFAVAWIPRFFKGGWGKNELYNIEDYFYSFLTKSNYNYSKETLNLMIQIKTLSPRKFPETHKEEGYNAPRDLHMEHLNQRMKTMIATWCYT